MQTRKFKKLSAEVGVLAASLIGLLLMQNIAFAQSTSRADMVVEMQQVRAEIAELRDLIERQQYRIRQLERKLDQARQAPSLSPEPSSELPPQANEVSPSVGASTGTSAGENTVATIPAPGQATPEQTSTEQAYVPAQAASQTGVSETFTQANSAYGAPTAAPVPASSPSTNLPATAAPQSTEDFYRPYNDNAPVVDENPEVVSAARQASQASDLYPPVVERSVGAPATQSAASSVSTSTPAAVSAPSNTAATNPNFSTTNPQPVSQQPPQVVGQTPSTWNTSTTAANDPYAAAERASQTGNTVAGIPAAGVPAAGVPTAGAGGVVQVPSGVITGVPSRSNNAPIGGVAQNPVVVPGSSSGAVVEANNVSSGGLVAAPAPTTGAAPAPTQAQQSAVQQTPAQQSQVQQSPVQQPVVAALPEDTLYQQGFEMLKQFKYDEAVSIFKQQIQQYPQGSYADDAYYWIAESMYLNRDLPESKQYFRSIIDNFSQSPRVPDAMLKTAYIEQDQGNEIEARILLQEIIQYHPRSDAAISAKNRLEQLN